MNPTTITYKLPRSTDELVAKLAKAENRSKTKQLVHMVEHYLLMTQTVTMSPGGFVYPFKKGQKTVKLRDGSTLTGNTEADRANADWLLALGKVVTDQTVEMIIPDEPFDCGRKGCKNDIPHSHTGYGSLKEQV